MELDNFAPTNNFFCKARNNARFGFSIRRAFFMPIRHFFDASDKILSAACLKWYLNYSHFNFSLCGELFVGDKEGSRFSEFVQELSDEHFAAAAEFQHQHKKFI